MTNIILWMIAGSAAGWIGYSFMNLNEKRGILPSILIGMFGGFIGGKLVAPMLAAGSAAHPDDFSPLPLFVAFASAAVILVISSMIHKRFGF